MAIRGLSRRVDAIARRAAEVFAGNASDPCDPHDPRVQHNPHAWTLRLAEHAPANRDLLHAATELLARARPWRDEERLGGLAEYGVLLHAGMHAAMFMLDPKHAQRDAGPVDDAGLRAGAELLALLAIKREYEAATGDRYPRQAPIGHKPPRPGMVPTQTTAPTPMPKAPWWLGQPWWAGLWERSRSVRDQAAMNTPPAEA